MWDVVVIGAGLSGLTAARHLHETGFTVLVIDKSRGLGGRLATRRVKGQAVDHGCRFLQPGAVQPFALVTDLLTAAIIQPWQPQLITLDVQNQAVISPRSETYYIAPEGINTVAKAMAEGLLIQRLCRVIGVLPIPKGWQIKVETESANAEPIQARAVVMAIPAPQMLPILEAAQTQIPALTKLRDQIEAVQFDPVITVMAGYAPNTEAALPGQVSPKEGWMLWGHETSTIRWAALDSSKRPNAAAPAIVIHSGGPFAESFLEAQTLDLAGQRLLEAIAEPLGAWLKAPDWTQVHRWRYGLVKIPADSQIVRTQTVPTLVGCGDWCGGYDAQAAVTSGEAAATHLAQALS